MSHKTWCAVQKGCITPGAKPCRMCETAYNAGREDIPSIKELDEAFTKKYIKKNGRVEIHHPLNVIKFVREYMVKRVTIKQKDPRLAGVTPTMEIIQPHIDKVVAHARKRFGEPFTTQVDIWNDNTFQVCSFQHKQGIKRVTYLSSLDEYLYQSFDTGKKDIERVIERGSRADEGPDNGKSYGN